LDKWIANYEQIGRRLFTAENLIEAVCSGEAQWPSVFGPEVRNCFDLGIADPDLFLLFNQAMYQANLLESHLVAASIESDDVLDVLDVGGGPGAWLDALSSEGVKLGRALNYEFYGTLPVMVKVRDTLGLPRGGFDFIGGNFFEQSDGHAGLFGLDPGDRFDLVSLNWILHDWSDDRCVEILGKVKHHLKPNGFLVVQEALLPPSRLGRNTMGDMMILLQTGGTERTVGDFRRIFDLRNLSVKTVLDFGTRRSVLAVQANH
jgi:SAM-dependent methyltransferase